MYGALPLPGDIGGCNLRQYATYNTNGVEVKVREAEKHVPDPLIFVFVDVYAHHADVPEGLMARFGRATICTRPSGH